MTKILNLIINFKNDYPVTFGLIIFIIIFIFLNKVSKNFLKQTELEKRKIPEFLKILRTENNLDFLRIKRTHSETTNYKDCINEKKKGKDKFKNAEKKLLKLLSTKNC